MIVQLNAEPPQTTSLLLQVGKATCALAHDTSNTCTFDLQYLDKILLSTTAFCNRILGWFRFFYAIWMNQHLFLAKMSLLECKNKQNPVHVEVFHDSAAKCWTTSNNFVAFAGWQGDMSTGLWHLEYLHIWSICVTLVRFPLFHWHKLAKNTYTIQGRVWLMPQFCPNPPTFFLVLCIDPMNTPVQFHWNILIFTLSTKLIKYLKKHLFSLILSMSCKWAFLVL